MNARLDRKKRTCEDVGIKSSGGMFDLFDNAIKETFRVNDAEYDFIVENATDDELEFLITENMRYDQKRQVIKLLDKYLTKFNETVQ